MRVAKPRPYRFAPTAAPGRQTCTLALSPVRPTSFLGQNLDYLRTNADRQTCTLALSPVRPTSFLGQNLDYLRTNADRQPSQHPGAERGRRDDPLGHSGSSMVRIP